VIIDSPGPECAGRFLKLNRPKSCLAPTYDGNLSIISRAPSAAPAGVDDEILVRRLDHMPISGPWAEAEMKEVQSWR